MLVSGVLARGVKLQGVIGYDVVITNNSATVGDYINALDELIISGDLFRSRDNVRCCTGCDLCCRERVPLTWIDVLTLARGLGLTTEPLGPILDKVGKITIAGPVVDIVLRRDSSGNCGLLNPQTKLCRVYQSRPLVCSTFICCPTTRRADQLREVVINKGEDELVRRWIEGLKASGERAGSHLCLEDYPPSAFAGKSKYDDVLLSGLCSPALWSKLIKD